MKKDKRAEYMKMELNKIYCMNCLEGLKQLEDNSIDLVVTDPPYGILIGGSGKIGGSGIVEVKQYTPVTWDETPLSKEILKELIRISKNQILFGYNYYSDILPPTNGLIVWDKKCQNDWDDNFSDGEIAWTSFKRPLRIFRHLYMGALKKEKEKRFHPTQKPLTLFRWLINKYSKETDIILDPFMGSGTTAVACKELGRNYIGFEISEEYCKIAEERLNKVNNKKLSEWFEK